MAKENGEAKATTVPPTVGRIVHYYATVTRKKADEGGAVVRHPEGHPRAGKPVRETVDECRAAIVVAVDADGVPTLQVFQPDGGQTTQHGVTFSPSPKAGCWSWPPRA